MTGGDPTVRLACVQMTAGTGLEANLDQAERFIREAASAGASIIGTPECTGVLAHGRERMLEASPCEADHPGPSRFSRLASELGVWLLIGSLNIKVDAERIANRSYLFAPDGSTAATYDKIHMFDVDLPGGESYRESRTYQPGTRPVLADTPWGGLGLTICYDVRFAGLYRTLARAGARILAVPAAFTRQTGEAHWHILLRARAIETGCFVFAPAQTGTHDMGRETFGHSLIVAPWGEVLADGGTDVGVVTADLDLSAVARARQAVPAITLDDRFAPLTAATPASLLS